MMVERVVLNELSTESPPLRPLGETRREGAPAPTMLGVRAFQRVVSVC